VKSFAAEVAVVAEAEADGVPPPAEESVEGKGGIDESVNDI
jgi:hypothetical protein